MAESAEAKQTESATEGAGSARTHRRATSRASADGPMQELENELAGIEAEERGLRQQRAELLAELADEADSESPDLDRVEELRTRLRRLDRDQRELNLRRAEVQQDMEREFRFIARRPAASTRQRARRRSATRSRQATDQFYGVDPGYGRDPYYSPGGRVISQAISEHARLGNALLVGHLGVFGATADALGALTDELYARAVSRADRPMELAMNLPTDLSASAYNAAEHLVEAPRRAADAFYGSYQPNI